MPKFRRSRALIVGSALVLLVAAFSVDYTVERGDTLGRIAQDKGVSLSDLIAENDINNPNLIFPGQVLHIPGENGRPDITHVVRRGETLNQIASRYKASVSNIVKVNSIPNPNLILIGDRLLIPIGSVTGGRSSDESDSISDRTGTYHVVSRGETVASIAAKYSGVSADDIIRANGIVNGIIYAGSALYLSGPGYVASGGTGGGKHKVRSGDRLIDIANSHGVSLTDLINANGLSNPNLIRIGQTLTIPGGSAWVCPVKGAFFMNDWGFPRGGGTRYHEGNDLFANRGTPVKAPVSGTVDFKTGTIGGYQFRLAGSDGVVYIGTHMDGFGEEGKVSAGDVIGYVGNSGNAAGTRPHLHFGMYYNGTPVNPYPSLVRHGC